MAHFYGGVHGQAGDATRMGSKRSGYRAFAQTNQARVSVQLGHVERTEPPYTHPDSGSEDGTGDIAHVTIEGGWSTYYRSRSVSFNPNNVAAALDCGDAKVTRIWARIEAEFAKLDAEAIPALKRAERRRKIEDKRVMRERHERQTRLDALRETVTVEELHNYNSLAWGGDPPEWVDAMDDITRDHGYGEPYRNDDGHLVFFHNEGGSFGQIRRLDLTACRIIEEVATA